MALSKEEFKALMAKGKAQKAAARKLTNEGNKLISETSSAIIKKKAGRPKRIENKLAHLANLAKNDKLMTTNDNITKEGKETIKKIDDATTKRKRERKVITTKGQAPPVVQAPQVPIVEPIQPIAELPREDATQPIHHIKAYDDEIAKIEDPDEKLKKDIAEHRKVLIEGQPVEINKLTRKVHHNLLKQLRGKLPEIKKKNKRKKYINKMKVLHATLGHLINSYHQKKAELLKLYADVQEFRGDINDNIDKQKDVMNDAYDRYLFRRGEDGERDKNEPLIVVPTKEQLDDPGISRAEKNDLIRRVRNSRGITITAATNLVEAMIKKLKIDSRKIAKPKEYNQYTHQVSLAYLNKKAIKKRQAEADDD